MRSGLDAGLRRLTHRLHFPTKRFQTGAIYTIVQSRTFAAWEPEHLTQLNSNSALVAPGLMALTAEMIKSLLFVPKQVGL